MHSDAADSLEVRRRERRQQAGCLLNDVLEERLAAQLAITRWPESGAQDLPDPSLDTAWQALWHFEADEHRQKTELFYLDAQLELLRQMAGFLSQGQDLPAYFLHRYSKEHRIRFFYNLPVWQDSLHILRQLGSQIGKIWRDAWALNRRPSS